MPRFNENIEHYEEVADEDGEQAPRSLVEKRLLSATPLPVLK
ncbi:hypothetical protein [Paraburkholderia sp. UYCP14C]|nr:hypothetical protein [Paraburkholderia sp. UYCP14C]